jgi:hypothetical protein
MSAMNPVLQGDDPRLCPPLNCDDKNLQTWRAHEQVEKGLVACVSRLISEFAGTMTCRSSYQFSRASFEMLSEAVYKISTNIEKKLRDFVIHDPTRKQSAYRADSVGLKFDMMRQF